ncbi:MAG TPA: phage holin family protein [Burkholderiales bacterium]|nr:phage holin family protein [Burkholderiales bacterium]
MAYPGSEEAPDAPQGGLLYSLRTAVATLIATVRTRGELLRVELEEEWLRVTGIAVFALAAAFFLALGVLLLSFFLILLFWDTNRVLVSGLLALAYLLIGTIFALVARQRSHANSKLLVASLAELSKDGERLTDGL